jgi:GDP-L-fucose synthase
MTPNDFELSGRRVYVAGHRGMVGAAIVRRLADERCEILTAARDRLDLTCQAQVDQWFARERPEVVFLAAARVGGIHANATYPADFIYDNLAIASNAIHAAHATGVAKLVFLGSSCIYPREAPQPMTEACLLTGPLEPTNEWYAVAKIAGLKLCQAYRRQHDDDFVSVMPTNLYGPGDNFHPENSHVPAALMRRFHEARRDGAATATVWGTGQARREFLFVDDLADACVFVARHYSGHAPLNVGTGTDLSIAEFAEVVRRVVGFAGSLEFDPSRPDGAPRKLLDVSRIQALGWRPRTPLAEGLQRTYAWFRDAVAN